MITTDIDFVALEAVKQGDLRYNDLDTTPAVA
jgi:hypothetical protein